MKKFLKITAVVVILFLATALVLPMAMRGKIEQIVKQEANEMLNARLDFDRLDISLLRHFPHASIELKGLLLTGVDRFEGDTIAAADRISVVVNLLSLFSSDGYEVTKILFAHPSLNARKLEDGAVNWDIMKASEESAEEETSSEPSSFRLQIRDFRISDAEIRYVDDSSHMSFATKPFNLRLSGDMTAQQTTLDLTAKAQQIDFVSGGIPFLNHAEVALDAEILADLQQQRYTFSENSLRLNAIVMGLDGWMELGDEAISMDLSAGCEAVKFKDILSLVPALYMREFGNLTATGTLDMNLWAKGELRDNLLPAFEARAEVHDGTFRYTSLPKAVTGINIAARVANPGGVMDLTEVDLSKCTMQMADNHLALTFHATNLESDPRFNASANGSVNLGEVKDFYPLEKGTSLTGEIAVGLKVAAAMSDIEKQCYEKIAASGTMVVEHLDLALENLPAVSIRRAAASINPQAMTLGEMGVTVGRSDLSAKGQLTGYLGYLLRGDMLNGRLYVDSNLLDLNELMAALPDTEETPQEEESEMQAIPVPKNLNLILNTNLKKILFGKMTIDNLQGEMRVADGAVKLNHLGMGLFGGQATASGSYSTADDELRPDLKMDLGLKQASFARTFEELELVQRLVPFFSKTGGDYSMSLQMSTRLDSKMSPELMTVNATGELKSANIRLSNIPLISALGTALNSEKLAAADAREIALRFAIKDGLITTQPFDLKLGATTLRLSGTTGLDQSIDYTARVALPSSVTGGVVDHVNARIGGTFTSPKISIDMKEAARAAAENVVNTQIQKLTGSENLSEELQKRAQQLRDEAQKAGDKLVEEAEKQSARLVEEASKKGKLAQLAAQKAGEALVKKAQEKSAQLVEEADRQAAKLTSEKSAEAAE